QVICEAVGCQPSAVGEEAVGCQPSAVGKDGLFLPESRQPMADGPNTDSRHLKLSAFSRQPSVKSTSKTPNALGLAGTDGRWLTADGSICRLSPIAYRLFLIDFDLHCEGDP